MNTINKFNQRIRLIQNRDIKELGSCRLVKKHNSLNRIFIFKLSNDDERRREYEFTTSRTIKLDDL